MKMVLCILRSLIVVGFEDAMPNGENLYCELANLNNKCTYWWYVSTYRAERLFFVLILLVLQYYHYNTSILLAQSQLEY